MEETVSGTNTAPQINDLLNGLMSNPEALNMITSLMKSMPKSSAEETSPRMEETPASEAVRVENPNPLGGINPEMLKMLPNLMSMLGPMMSKPRDAAANKKDEAVEAGAGVSGGGSHKPRHRSVEQRNKLMYALKPYLSPSRREAVEQIVKITEITDILGETGLIPINKEKEPHNKKNGELGEIHKI